MKTILRIFLGVCVIWLSIACSDNLTDAQHVEKAQDYLGEGNLGAANIELKNALLKNKDNTQARMMLGRVYLEAGDAAGAEKELRNASRLGVVDEAVLPLLARSLLEQGKHDQLQILYLKNAAAREQNASLLATQGLGRLVQGNPDAARELIDEALLLDPHSIDAVVAMAILLTEEGNDEQARKTLDKIFVVEPNHAKSWSVLGDLESRAKNFAKAEAAYTKAIDNRVNNLTDYFNRARTRIRLNKDKEAQEDIDVLKSRFPKHAGVNYLQGQVYFHANQFP